MNRDSWLLVAAILTAVTAQVGCVGSVPAPARMATQQGGFAIAQSAGFVRVDPPQYRWGDVNQQEWTVDPMGGKATVRSSLGPGRSFTKTFQWTPPPAAIPAGGMVFTYGGTVTTEDPTDRLIMTIDVRFDGVLTNPQTPPTAEAWANRPGWAASAAQSVGVTPRNDLPPGSRGYYRVIIQGGPVIEYTYTH